MGDIVKHCVDCGAEFDGKSARCPRCRIAYRRRQNVARARKNRGTSGKKRVCKTCGADISHLHKSCRYCEACAEKNSRKWDPSAVSQRIALKVEAQRKRTARVLAEIDAEFGVRRRGSVDEAVSTYTNKITGNKVEWRGMRCGAGGGEHHD